MHRKPDKLPNIDDLIQEILKEEWNNGNKQILTIKLIKLLYLTEYEYYKKNRKRLTQLKWIFYKYGPFAFELQKLHRKIVNLEEEQKELDSGKVIKLLGIDYADGFIHHRFVINTDIGAIIKTQVRIWQNKSTRELLNYVYHHTEPMLYTERGDEIDFSVIPIYKFTHIKRIAPDRVRKMRKILKSNRKKKFGRALYPLPELTDEWKKRAAKAIAQLELEG